MDPNVLNDFLFIAEKWTAAVLVVGAFVVFALIAGGWKLR